MKIQWGRPPIYKWRSLGKQGRGVWWGKKKYGATRILTLVNAAPSSYILEGRSKQAQSDSSPPPFMLNDTYSTEIKNNETHWCSTPKACVLLLWGKLGTEVVVGESGPSPMSWGMLLVFLLRGWTWSVGTLSPRSSSHIITYFLKEFNDNNI